jgi:hypothetical protein
VRITDERWTLKGDWDAAEQEKPQYLRSQTAGAEASITFEGTGAMLVGHLREDGGYLQVFLNGRRVAETDGHVFGGNRRGESLWHVDDLKPGQHTLRVVVSGKRFPKSRGAWVYLERLVVFQK